MLCVWSHHVSGAGCEEPYKGGGESRDWDKGMAAAFKWQTLWNKHLESISCLQAAWANIEISCLGGISSNWNIAPDQSYRSHSFFRYMARLGLHKTLKGTNIIQTPETELPGWLAEMPKWEGQVHPERNWEAAIKSTVESQEPHS